MVKHTNAIIAVVVVVILIAAGVSVLEFYHPAKATSSVLTDTSQTAAPGELDPATGFFTYR